MTAYHVVDSNLEFEDLALHIGSDRLGQIASSDGFGLRKSDSAASTGRFTHHLCNLSDLVRQIAGHFLSNQHQQHLLGIGETHVDVRRQVLPDAFDSVDDSLSAKDTLSADLERDSGHLIGERGQLPNHRVDRLPRQRSRSDCRSTIGATHILQNSHFALRLNLNHLAQVAPGDSGGDTADTPYLRRERVTHPVDLLD